MVSFPISPTYVCIRYIFHYANEIMCLKYFFQLPLVFLLEIRLTMQTMHPAEQDCTLCPAWLATVPRATLKSSSAGAPDWELGCLLLLSGRGSKRTNTSSLWKIKKLKETFLRQPFYCFFLGGLESLCWKRKPI